MASRPTTGAFPYWMAGVFALLVVVRVPVAFALGLACVPVFFIDDRLTPFLLLNEMLKSYNSFLLLSIPFFMLAANLMNVAGITDKLIDLSRALVGWLPGGLGHVSVLVSMLFAGISGSSTAEAAGVSGVLLTRGCADPLSPKALRASAGSAFRLPHVLDLAVDDLFERWPRGLTLAAAVAGPGSPSVFDAPLGLPLVLALGSEGSGLDPRIEAAANRRIRIPSARSVESLNVAAAGAIVMFEIARRAGILRS